MKILTLLLLFSLPSMALEGLDLPDWNLLEKSDKEFLLTEKYTKSEINGKYIINRYFSITKNGSSFAYSQGFLVIVGKEKIADVMVSYDKNGNYLTQFINLGGSGIVSYGKYRSKDIEMADSDYISIRQQGDEVKDELLYVKRGFLFIIPGLQKVKF